MLQKKILKSAYTLDDGSVHETGRLALGVPGQFYDASPRRVFTETIQTDGEYRLGTFVEGKGVLVNVRELALTGDLGNGEPLTPSLELSKGDAASYCTFGHVVVLRADLENIMSGMNATVIAGDPEDYLSEEDTVVVALDGFKSGYPPISAPLCFTAQ